MKGKEILLPSFSGVNATKFGEYGSLSFFTVVLDLIVFLGYG